MTPEDRQHLQIIADELELDGHEDKAAALRGIAEREDCAVLSNGVLLPARIENIVGQWLITDCAVSVHRENPLTHRPTEPMGRTVSGRTWAEVDIRLTSHGKVTRFADYHEADFTPATGENRGIMNFPRCQQCGERKPLTELRPPRHR